MRNYGLQTCVIRIADLGEGERANIDVTGFRNLSGLADLSGILFHGFEQWFQYHVCGYSIVEKISQKSLAHLRFTIEMVKMNAPHAEVSTKH